MLQEAPQLSGRGALAFLAWRDLSGERAFGMTVGPIPWRAIVAWCDRYGVAESEELIELVQAIDTEWLRDESPGTGSHGDPANPKGQARH